MWLHNAVKGTAKTESHVREIQTYTQKQNKIIDNRISNILASSDEASTVLDTQWIHSMYKENQVGSSRQNRKGNNTKLRKEVVQHVDH